MSETLPLGVIIGFLPEPRVSLGKVRDLGIPTVQVSYAESLDNEAGFQAIQDALQEMGVTITSLVCGYPGESYKDIPTVRATVGLVPEGPRAERLERTRRIAKFAHRLGVRRVQGHIGFIPEEPEDPQYARVVAVMRDVCRDVAADGQVFALETGQETAATLSRFIDDVGEPNLRVNFDPANMILYGNDNPIEALDVLMPYIDGIHCKDGRWPTEAGKLGHETPLGEGDVDFTHWLTKLLTLGYRGPLTIEREISGEQQQRDIRRAKELIASVTQAFLA